MNLTMKFYIDEVTWEAHSWFFLEFFETLFSRFARVCTRSLVCTRYVAFIVNYTPDVVYPKNACGYLKGRLFVLDQRHVQMKIASNLSILFEITTMVKAPPHIGSINMKKTIT